MRVDKNGKDDYEVSHNGRTVKVAENTESDNVYSLNKKGERVNCREYKYGTIQLSSAKKGKENYYIMKVKGDDQAKDLFEFLATPENYGLKAGQNVEWGRVIIGKAGVNGINFFMTSGEISNNGAFAYLFDKQLKYGYTIRGLDHNHPDNNNRPSGTDGAQGDATTVGNIKANQLGNVTKDALFRIFTPGLQKKYHVYNENSVWELDPYVITFKRPK
jgi:hypothetical protein